MARKNRKETNITRESRTIKVPISKNETYTKTTSKVTSESNRGFPFSSFVNINSIIVLFFAIIFGSTLTYFIRNKEIFLPSTVDEQMLPFETLTGDEALIQYMSDRGVPLDNSLDTPIYEGLSLRDVFETNNLVVNGDFTLDSNADGLADNWLKGSRVYDTIIDINGQNWKSTGFGAYNDAIIYTFDTTAGDFYISYTMNNNVRFRLYSPTGGYRTINEATSGTFSNIQTLLEDDIWLYFTILTADTNAYINNIFLINTSIFTTAPSQAQLDEWLDMYLTLKSGGNAPIFDTTVPAWELLDLQEVYDNYDPLKFEYKNYYFLETYDYNQLGVNALYGFEKLTSELKNVQTTLEKVSFYWNKLFGIEHVTEDMFYLNDEFTVIDGTTSFDPKAYWSYYYDNGIYKGTLVYYEGQELPHVEKGWYLIPVSLNSGTYYDLLKTNYLISITEAYYIYFTYIRSD